MKKAEIKYEFSIKSKEELRDLSYEELIEYTKNLTDEWHKKNKPKKNSTNSGIPTGKEIDTPKRNQSTRKKGSF